MKIYTKTGDQGQTGLLTGARVRKDHVRLHAYGTVDELNAVLGIVLAEDAPEGLAAKLLRIQHELFDLGSDLATPLASSPDWLARLSPDKVTRLEEEIDEFTGQLEELRHFILPGGTRTAAYLHQARTICRRGERWVVALEDDVNPAALQYINRLSDWLFIAARYANAVTGQSDVIWKGPDA